MRFRNGCQLSTATGSFQYHVGGPHSLLLVIWKLPTNPMLRSQTDEACAHQHDLDSLPRYCSNQQWSSFCKEFGDVMGSGGVPTCLLRRLFKKLSNDSTCKKKKVMEQRVLQYCLAKGDDRLWPDLCAALNGRAEQFTEFYKTAKEVIEEISGASPYRHGSKRVLRAVQTDLVSSMNSSLVSIRALYNCIISRMRSHMDPIVQNSPHPSEELLRISLCPQYPSRAVSKAYHGRFELTRGVQQATMRKFNQDSYYNNKLNLYGNHLIVETNDFIYDLQPGFSRPTQDNSLIFSKGITKISVDDKAAIPIGEPGYPVRTNVCKLAASLASSKDVKESSALDHDFHRANVRPSIALVITTPATVGESWRYGRVVCSLKDAATQSSTPMHHSIEPVKKIEALVVEEDTLVSRAAGSLLEGTSKPYSFIIRSDGGSDRNPKNASVQLAMVYAFLKLKADLLICLITAADVSHVNEVEGVMPVANIVLQNQAYARQSMGQDFEETFRPAATAKKIRETIQKVGSPGLTAWRDSLKPVVDQIEERFKKISYSGDGVLIQEPADDEDILHAWDEMKQRIDPTLDRKKTTWAFVHKNNAAFCSFVSTHVLVERYHIEIRKCNDPMTCHVCDKVRMQSSPRIANTLCLCP